MKSLNFLLLIAFTILYGAVHTYGQTAKNNPDLQTINNFMEGYNTQNFDQMSDQLSGVMKLVFTKSVVKKIYTYQYQILGKAKIISIKNNGSSYKINLVYDRDTTEIEELGLSISKKSKIVGMGSTDPKLNFPTHRPAGNVDEARIKAIIDSLVSQKHFSGNFSGCFMVLKNNTTYYNSCEGYATVDTEAKLSDSTLFDLASLSKQFTAMATMLLIKEGKLSYQNKIEDFYPNFPYPGISIEHLLTHTSGLPDYMELFEQHWDKNKVATNEDVLQLLIKFKPKRSFKPNKQYEYSNTGYVILASILEKVSGKSFADLLESHIFKPLGMKKSGVYDMNKSEKYLPPHTAQGHVYMADKGTFTLAKNVTSNAFYTYLGGITGDGGIYSTLAELAIWDNSIREYTLLPKDVFDKAIAPYQTKKELSQYGYGWELSYENNFERLIYHSGNWAGNTHFMLHFLDKKITVIGLSNNEYNNIQNLVIKVATEMNDYYR